MDYVFANQRARRPVINSKIWENDYVAGSGHMLVSCIVKPRPAYPPVTASGSGTIRTSNYLCRIRKGDINDPLLRAAVVREFKAGRK